MTATPPEAKTEYSRAGARFSGPHGPSIAALGAGRLVALAAGLLGAVLLLVAEFTTLYTVHLVTSLEPVQTVSAGSHNAFALIPLAILAVLLALGAARTGSQAALAALAGVGVIALLIALVGDLPDAHTQGLTRRYVLAATTPGVGLYLETVGAVALLLASGVGLVAGGAPTRLGAALSRPPRARRAQG